MVEMGKVASIVLYFAVYMVSAYLMSKSRIMEEKKLDLAFVVAVLLPVLLAAKRYFVGTDFENYYFIYNRMSRCSFRNWIAEEMSLDGNPLGLWFAARIAFQFRSYEMYYGLLAAIIFIPPVLFFHKNFPKEIIFLAVFAFCTSHFTNGFNGIKQYAAISIIIFALDYVYERRFWKYALSIFLAFCFHPTAVIAFPIYFLWKPEGVTVSFKRVFLIGCFVFLLVLAPQLLTALGGRFTNYANSVEDISNKSFYLNLAWLVFFLVMRGKYIEFDFRNDLLITLVIVGQILGISGFYSPAVNRISLYFSFSRTLLLFQIPYVFDKEEKSLFKILVFLYMAVMFIVNYYFYEFSDILPYKYFGGI